MKTFLLPKNLFVVDLSWQHWRSHKDQIQIQNLATEFIASIGTLKSESVKSSYISGLKMFIEFLVKGKQMTQDVPQYGTPLHPIFCDWEKSINQTVVVLNDKGNTAYRGRDAEAANNKKVQNVVYLFSLYVSIMGGKVTVFIFGIDPFI